MSWQLYQPNVILASWMIFHRGSGRFAPLFQGYTNLVQRWKAISMTRIIIYQDFTKASRYWTVALRDRTWIMFFYALEGVVKYDANDASHLKRSNSLIHRIAQLQKKKKMSANPI